VSADVLVLALISTVRPTTAAAVWAMLIGSRPRRLLAIYLLAGLAVSLTAGIGGILLFGGTFDPRTFTQFRGYLLVVLGVAAVLAAVAVLLGRVHRFEASPAGTPSREPRRLTPAGAAITGVLTHLPGVVYLAALGTIATAGVAAASEVAQVVVYNLVWFAPSIVALGICVFGTVPSSDSLAGLAAWGRAHHKAILTACFGGIGVWMLVTGISDLA
jgi:Sap, sulfolipid-1-addressing protein